MEAAFPLLPQRFAPCIRLVFSQLPGSWPLLLGVWVWVWDEHPRDQRSKSGVHASGTWGEV